MSYITKQVSVMEKDNRNRITLNKDLFAFTSDFTDIYFANDLNWKKVAIHFKHATSNQRKIIVLMKDSDSGWFELSETSRTGSWGIEQIQIFDKDGDMYPVKREDMPSPSDFDIQTILKIAPFESIVSFVDSYNPVLAEGKGGLYEVGFKVRVWDLNTLDFHNQTVYTILAINGDQVTLDYPITNATNKSLKFKFPEFRNSSLRQRSFYQYVNKTFGDLAIPDPVIEPPLEN
jgi:hypothetical protein